MIIWVALGGRGRLWGAMAGALIVNYAYSITTSDMPRAWPFLEGGMFLIVVMLFPSGLVGLWDRFEQDIVSGVRVSGILTALAVGFLALLIGQIRLGSSHPLQHHLLGRGPNDAAVCAPKRQPFRHGISGHHVLLCDGGSRARAKGPSSPMAGRACEVLCLARHARRYRIHKPSRRFATGTRERL